MKYAAFFFSVEGFNPEDEAMINENRKGLKCYRNIHARNPRHAKYFPLENKHMFLVCLNFAFKTIKCVLFFLNV
jgi:hypothetical protein